MKTGPSSILVSFGTIFLSFGLVFLIIELLATAFGTRREIGVMLGIGSLVIGGLLAGAGVFMGKSRDGRSA
jgi:hypothetical protein